MSLPHPTCPACGDAHEPFHCRETAADIECDIKAHTPSEEDTLRFPVQRDIHTGEECEDCLTEL